MSDSDAYSYEYDEDSAGGNEEASFEYTDDETSKQDDAVNIENTYYNAKASRDNGEFTEAIEGLESVVVMEVESIRKGSDDDDNTMEVDETKSNLHTPLKYHGSWSYKAIKQLIKLHLRQLSDNNDLETNSAAVTRNYERMLRVASSKEAGISPNAVEKGVNGMLERVSSLVNNYHSSDPAYESMGRALARDVYDLTLKAFHPTNGISPNERLWSKTNLKYGQLLYEMNETAKLQAVIKDLLASTSSQSSGESDAMSFDNNAQSGTNAMEIAALQIQLYSRLKDTKKLREAYHSAMAVRGGIPHPRTLAMIQELGGKMHMDSRNFDEASQAFFQAFKSYDEAGDRARLRCLKYLVMASMLHASSINPFDSHEARAHRDDPEIVAMTNLVQAFHNDDVKKFERILQKNEGRIMDDDFVRDHVADLLRTIRTQVILRSIGPYTRIRLARIAKDLNDIPVEDVESLLVSLILNGKLKGQIDQVNGIFVKASSHGESEGTPNTAKTSTAVGSTESRTTAAIAQLTAALEHLSGMTTKIASKGTFIEARQ